MPKKTKKEKIIAEYRRKMASAPHADGSSAPSSQNEQAPVQQPKQTFSYTSFVTANRQTQPSSLILDATEFTAIKKDLLWTLILTTGILIGEIGLWKLLG